jgi:brefeldin A-resistance guanine nucleotide exchange factor 1
MLPFWNNPINLFLIIFLTQYEAVPESLKNCLLVMSTSDTFSESMANMPGNLWNVTWNRINKFLPNLKAEVFPPQSSESGASYAALMMGVGKTLFTGSGVADPAGQKPAYGPSTSVPSPSVDAGVVAQESPSTLTSDVVAGVDHIVSQQQQEQQQPIHEDESSLL